MKIFIKFTYFSTLFTFLISCGDSSKKVDNFNQNASPKVIRIGEIAMPTNITPHKITTAVEGLIVSQLYEGLLKINSKDLTLMPGLAESWDINQTTKTITFHLRKGLSFQNNKNDDAKGDEITSKDVLYTFELLSSDSPENYHFQTVSKDRIVGANEFYEATSRKEKIELKGFKIIDDYNFSIQLHSSPSIFLEILANPVASIISKKGYEENKENNSLGAGPFILDEKTSTKTHYAMYKNQNYHAKDSSGNSLPYIDSVIVDILANNEELLNGFEKGNLDFINYVPTNQVNRLVSENIQSFKNPPKYLLDQSAEMITSYYLFNINKTPFNNLKLRQAINYAIDRNKIVDAVLMGQAFGPAIHGIVPPTFDFYKTSTIKGYELDVKKAKKLLAEAGYPDGKGLGEIQLLINPGRARNSSVAVEIQKQLKTNLNVNITFENVSELVKLEMQNKGKGELYRSGWVADYPNPESFLSVFYGNYFDKDTSKIHFPNTTNYNNKAFNLLYEKGRDAINKDTAIAYFLKAEQVLINDAPFIPLWHESNCRLMKFRIKNFYSNPMRYFDFTQVKISDK